MTAQEISDKFAFLEGLVNEATYRKITKTAEQIYSVGSIGGYYRGWKDADEGNKVLDKP